MRYTLIALLFIFLGSVSIIAEDDPGRDILLYGMESDVLSMLADLKRDHSTRYNDLLAETYPEFQDTKLLQAIYLLWEDTKYKKGLPIARKELDKALGDYIYSPQVVYSALGFIGTMQDTDAIPELLELVNFQNSSVSAAAVRAIAKIGLSDAPESANILLERLEEIENPELEDDLSASLILALGELKYIPAADYILLIAEDDASPLSHRQYACVALGKIGREEDYGSIERIYEDSGNAMLRSYALEGLTEFSGHDASEILQQALKRDPFWRIRLAAAEKLSGKNSIEVDALLRYKAVNDPVPQVRSASIRSLGKSADAESHTFMLKYLTDELHSAETRLVALNTLVENKIAGTIKVIREIMVKLWEKDQARFLEFICRELSTSSWTALEPLYSQMLTHTNWLIKVYGIRGIYYNNLTDQYARISSLDNESTDGKVRREIK